MATFFGLIEQPVAIDLVTALAPQQGQLEVAEPFQSPTDQAIRRCQQLSDLGKLCRLLVPELAQLHQGGGASGLFGFTALLCALLQLLLDVLQFGSQGIDGALLQANARLAGDREFGGLVELRPGGFLGLVITGAGKCLGGGGLDGLSRSPGFGNL
ncbi:hypothetical protein D9M71_613330 [compost metagenome]